MPYLDVVRRETCWGEIFNEVDDDIVRVHTGVVRLHHVGVEGVTPVNRSHLVEEKHATGDNRLAGDERAAEDKLRIAVDGVFDVDGVTDDGEVCGESWGFGNLDVERKLAFFLRKN